MEASREELAQGIQSYVRREVESVYISFPVKIIEHIGLIPMPDGTLKYGTAVGRAIVQPKMKTLLHNWQEIEMPEIINVPAPPFLRGPFMAFGAFDAGQTVMVSVSQVALDNLLVDGKTRHPQFPRFLDSKDAYISSDAIRTENMPLFPPEWHNCYGWMLLDDKHNPIAKLIITRNGQIRLEAVHVLIKGTRGVDIQGINGYTIHHDEPGHVPVSTVLAENVTQFKPGDITGKRIIDPSTDARMG